MNMNRRNKYIPLIWVLSIFIMCIGVTSNSFGQAEGQAWNAMDPGESWEYPSDSKNAHEIWIYTDEISYEPGDNVAFYVYSTEPKFDITISRDGGETKNVHQQSGISGGRQKTNAEPYKDGTGWKETFRFKIPQDWESGVYIVKANMKYKKAGTVEAEHFFVVRSKSANKKKIAFMLSTATYAAYNDWGKANSYRTKNTPAPQRILSLKRPWAKGFVSLPLEAPKYGQGNRLKPFENPRYPNFEWAFTHGYSRHYSDAGWAYFDAPFARWLEREGYEIDYLTQHDLHLIPGVLNGYKLVVFGGHDEYWSWEMRDAIDAFVNSGGNVARFGGNMLWQIRLEDGGHTMYVYKHAEDDPVHNTADSKRTTTFWEHPLVDRPSAATFGLTGTLGVYSNYGGAIPRGSGGYTVYRPEHWAFENTDLYFGDVFGGHPVNIVAYEVDGIDLNLIKGRPVPTFKDGAPKTTQILAMAPAIKGEEDHSGGHRLINAPLQEAKDVMGDKLVEDNDIDTYGEEVLKEIQPEDKNDWLYTLYGNSAIVVFTRGDGTVFNAGTATWVRGLQENDFYTEQITRNVLNKLSR